MRAIVSPLKSYESSSVNVIPFVGRIISRINQTEEIVTNDITRKRENEREASRETAGLRRLSDIADEVPSLHVSIKSHGFLRLPLVVQVNRFRISVTPSANTGLAKT